MPDALREEKNYYDVSGCGANIAWHTENDTLEIADRDILLTDMQHLPAVGAAHRQCRSAAVRLGCDLRRVSRNHRTTTRRPRLGMADLSQARKATEALKGCTGWT